MKILPETREELVPLIVRSLVLAVLSFFVAYYSEDRRVLADTDLQRVEGKEATDHAWLSYREYIEDTVTRQGRCDASLEAFSRHRDDERDWQHVLECCHSEGGIE